MRKGLGEGALLDSTCGWKRILVLPVVVATREGWRVGGGEGSAGKNSLRHHHPAEPARPPTLRAYGTTRGVQTLRPQGPGSSRH